ncbi:MAG: glycine/sarcosine/betaine reductase selenoprotein B family protein [Dehalococcoidia bacterium]
MSRRSFPYSPLRRALSECRVALVSTAGVHLKDQEPFNTEGDYTYRIIPGDVDSAQLMVTHGHYDQSDADKDIDCVFPIDRVRELAQEGFIEGLGDKHIGAMGTAPNLKQFYEELTPAVSREILHSQADIVLLTAG